MRIIHIIFFFLILVGCARIPLDVKLETNTIPKINPKLIQNLSKEQLIIFNLLIEDKWEANTIIGWFKDFDGSYPEEFMMHIKPLMQEEFRRLLGSYQRDDIVDSICNKYINAYYILTKKGGRR